MSGMYASIFSSFGFLLLEKLVQAFDLHLQAAFVFLLPLYDHLRLLIRLGMFGHHSL